MIFNGIGNKLSKLFSDIAHFFIDELLGTVYGWLGVAIEGAWGFFWRDTNRSLANDLISAAFPDLPDETRRQFQDAINSTSEAALPLLYFGIAGQVFSMIFTGSTTGYMQKLNQESLAHYRNTPLNPAQAATLERIGFMFSDEYVKTIENLGLPNSAVDGFRELAKNWLSINDYAMAWKRNLVTRELVNERAVRLGLDPNDTEIALQLQRQYLTIPVITDSLFRGIIDEATYYTMLGEIGYSREDADIFRNQQLFYPTPQDLILWIGHEVFEPDSIAKYGLADEFERLDLSMFIKAGVNEEQARNYWVAHWQHPSWTQMLEMLHRDIVTEDDVWEWFRLVEVPPFWRSKMIESAYLPLSRVDVRRMWDLGVVGDEEVVKTYRNQGYSQTDAESLLLFSKVERRLPDIFSRYSKGWINSDEAYNELLALGLTADKARYLWETKVINLARPLRVAAEKDLTKAEIVAGVKKEIIDPQEGVKMLVDIGYDEDEAELILKIQTDWQGSPETPLEFREGMELWRKAQGKPYKTISPVTFGLERSIIMKKKEIADEENGKNNSEKLAQLRADLAGLEFRFGRAKQADGL